MPKSTNTIRVKVSHGERGVYQVESWEKPSQPHRVDVFDMFGNGGCGCTDFTTRCIPNHRDHGGPVDYWLIRDGLAKPNPRRTRCRHVMAALKKWRDDELAVQAERETAH
jgi:hypothetical protein